MRKTSILLTLIFIFKAVYSRFYYDIFIHVHKVSWLYAPPVSLVTPLFLLIPILPNLPLPPTARSIHTLPVATSLSKMSLSPISCYSQWLPCGSTWAYKETEWGAERFRDLSKAAQVTRVWGERFEPGNLTSEFEIVALLCAGMGHYVPEHRDYTDAFSKRVQGNRKCWESKPPWNTTASLAWDLWTGEFLVPHSLVEGCVAIHLPLHPGSRQVHYPSSLWFGRVMCRGGFGWLLPAWFSGCICSHVCALMFYT